MSEPHPYRNLKIPSNAPIELKPSPGKGWGVFATRPIQKGTQILKDKALFVITKPAGQDVTEDDVVLAISQLCPYQTRQLLCLMDNGTTPFEYIMEVWAQNQFTLTDIPTAIGRGPCYQPGVTYATRPPTIIIDLDLKQAAESRDIPLSARFIHGILYVVLLEDEGLLDEFMEERIYSSVVFPPDMFESESNARIAERALEQDTWRGALGVAFELDGCSDPADRFVAEKLRRARLLPFQFYYPVALK